VRVARAIQWFAARPATAYKTRVSQESPTELPEKFLERLQEIVPPDRLEGVVESFLASKAATFRVNTLRAADEDVLAELTAINTEAQPVEGLAHVFRTEAACRRALVRCKAFSEGRLYVQNVSSLLAAPALNVEPGMAVLDLAAAPGGKTLHLACLMDNTGTLSAVESARGRFFRLRNNLRMHGVTCCRSFLKDGRKVGRVCRAQFDRVLLDAPCSGEAQLGGTGNAGSPNWSERKIRQCAGKQRALLTSAVEACRPGGLVLYCTCSMAPEENEAVIADALKRFAGELEVEPVPIPPASVGAATPALSSWRGRSWPAELAAAVRILPDNWFDAFFLCRLRKA